MTRDPFRALSEDELRKYRALSEDEVAAFQRAESYRNIVKEEGVGLKLDDGKERWDLLPLEEVQEVVRVLTLGAEKYGPYNWRTVENAEDRYFAAAMRHIVSHRLGEVEDQESGLHHLAHAICCLLFLMAGEEK